VTAPAGSEGSARRAELLELAYRYVLEHGVGELSLRPLAAAISSSPRVLLYLFGSKDGLLAALLERARADELAAWAGAVAAPGAGPSDPVRRAQIVWEWLASPERRGLLRLWLECYSHSLADNGTGPWAGFARQTVTDWLDLLSPDRPEDATLLLAVLRGAMLDLLATGDAPRVSSAVERYLASVVPPPGAGEA